MKLRLSVYLDPGLMAQLTKLAHRKVQPRSLIAEAANASFLTPDDADRREAALARRLDRMTRQVERLERDLTISAEALALFIRFWLTITPPLPDSAQTAHWQKDANVSNRSSRPWVDALQGAKPLAEVSINKGNDSTSGQTRHRNEAKA